MIEYMSLDYWNHQLDIFNQCENTDVYVDEFETKARAKLTTCEPFERVYVRLRLDSYPRAQLRLTAGTGMGVTIDDTYQIVYDEDFTKLTNANFSFVLRAIRDILHLKRQLKIIELNRRDDIRADIKKVTK